MSQELKLSIDDDYTPFPEYEHCSCDECVLMRGGLDYQRFLRAFFMPGESICYRAFPPKNSGLQGVKKTRAGVGFDVRVELSQWNQNFGVYFVVNFGGDKDEEIQRFCAFFCECDDLSLDSQNYRLDASPVPTSIRVETKKSVHAYWLLADDECTVEQWRDIQNRLIHYFKSDPKIKNPSRVMRLPYFDHVSLGESGLVRKLVTVTQFHQFVRRSAKEMQDGFPAVPVVTQKLRIAELDKLDGWDALNERTRQAIKSHSTYHEYGDYGHCQGVCHGGKGVSAIFIYKPTGAYKCMLGCNSAEIRSAFGLPDKPERKLPWTKQ